MADLDKLVDELSKLTVIEAAELATRARGKMGRFRGRADDDGRRGRRRCRRGGGEGLEFDVVLTSYGEKKINVIKEVRAITSLGLKEAKDLVEGVPNAVKEGCLKDEAEEIKKQARGRGCDGRAQVVCRRR